MKSDWIKIGAGPLAFLLCLVIGDTDSAQMRMLAIAAWMLIWWVTAAIPIGVTALLPIVLFPLLDILSLRETTINYANPVIYLFFGGFILGLAIEKWNLHKRIALNIMNVSGEKPSRIILGGMLATSLLSMWISNTATTVMMLPIGMSVIVLLSDKFKDPKAYENFALTLMLGIAYAANIGGVTTLIGTPPNLVLAGIVEESGMEPLSFANWFFFAFPLFLVLFISVYLVNTKLIYPVKIKSLPGIRSLIQSELLDLGKMIKGEKRVLTVMVITAGFWMLRAQITKIPGLEAVSDTGIAIAASIALFIIPSGSTTKPILEWDDTRKLPWDILLLFGGGISLARGLEVTDVVGALGGWISDNTIAMPLIIILVVCTFAVFLTEIMSNVALVAVFIPVSFVIAQFFGLDALTLAIPLTIGASCAFMFPISTPPNAIVFSSGHIKMTQMARVGVILNITSVIVISIYAYFFKDYFF